MLRLASHYDHPRPTVTLYHANSLTHAPVGLLNVAGTQLALIMPRTACRLSSIIPRWLCRLVRIAGASIFWIGWITVSRNTPACEPARENRAVIFLQGLLC